MSNYKIDKKTKVEECLRFSIYDLNQCGYLNSDCSSSFSVINGDIDEINFSFTDDVDNPSINLQYCSKNNYGQNEFIDYDIKLTYVPCNLGGKRLFFLCPAINVNNELCNNLCAVLYKPYYSQYFACRECHDLTYEACNISGIWKQFGKPISIIELEQARKRIKRPMYRGDTTRQFKAYIKKLKKSKSSAAQLGEYISKKYGYPWLTSASTMGIMKLK